MFMALEKKRHHSYDPEIGPHASLGVLSQFGFLKFEVSSSVSWLVPRLHLFGSFLGVLFYLFYFYRLYLHVLQEWSGIISVRVLHALL
jgi:hypothetical protein